MFIKELKQWVRLSFRTLFFAVPLILAVTTFANSLPFYKQAPARTALESSTSWSPQKIALMQESVNRINRLIERTLAENGKSYNVLLNDHVFIRRVYVDLTGTIPTYEQVQSFVSSRDPYKRHRIVNQLLTTEGYVSHNYNYFADMLRIKSNLPDGNLRLDPFASWLKKSIRVNRPYNRIVYDMISATGRIQENPAVGYHLRDIGMKLDHTSFMTKIFLAKDITCAQCHDHPFEEWTQKDFYSLAAFLGEMEIKGTSKASRKKVKPMNVSYTPAQRKLHRFLMSWGFEVALAEREGVSYTREKAKVQKQARELRQNFVNLMNDNRYNVRDNRTAVLKYPDDYQYEDAIPGGVVKPRVLLGTPTRISHSRPKREQLAHWIANPDNRWFALTIANRMWARFFGRGVAEPLHNVVVEDTVDPNLLQAITEIMQNLDYDLKAFSWVLVNTQAYNRLATQVNVPLKEDYFFPGPLLRRMSAEQVWDSFVTLMVENPLRYRTSSGLTLTNVNSKENALNFVESLAGMSGRRKKKGQLVLLDSETGLTVLRDNQSVESSAEAPSSQRVTTGSGKKKLILARASELEQPAPPGHFLRKFGQSERTFVVGASNLTGSVPQVMELMNGFATEALTHPDSLIFRKMKNEADPAKRAEVVFLSILSRATTKSERKLLLDQLSRGDDKDMADLIWALLTTPEFFFIK